MHCLFFHSSWPSFQWNPHSPWPLFQEMQHLYLLLLRFMVAVVRSLVSDSTGFLVTHSGSSFMYFLGVLPLETFPVDLQSFLIWPFLPHLWQAISDLEDDPLPEPLPFSLQRTLKSTWSKALLVDCSMATLYAFGSEGWYLDFSFLVAGSHRFISMRSWYSLVASYTRESWVIRSYCDMTSMSHTRSFLINSVTSLYFWIYHRRNLRSEVSSKMWVMYPSLSILKVPALSRRSASTKIAAQQSVTETLCQLYCNSRGILSCQYI